ncbi:hypothetical protein ABE28_011125 [Peribacillus muralis]|uniref:Uncharacterized protein n=1 Tax=Peribacillus muralis TaxID=264697 RepID=A0A1B3XNV7_9BACI|nr:hypothetical protein [Peribacillus muralis]AOH54904.1 hypothetical protein ABE28_011125 [Peribacillus muralis]
MNPFSYNHSSKLAHRIAQEDSISLSLVNGQILYNAVKRSQEMLKLLHEISLEMDNCVNLEMASET